MKSFIMFTLFLIALVLGHDAWVSYESEMPFALSDFGWVLTTYISDSEEFLVKTMMEYNQEERMGYIGMLLKLETVWVVSIFMGFFIVLGLFCKLSDGLGDLSLPSFGSSKKTPSLKKRDREKKLKYKMK